MTLCIPRIWCDVTPDRTWCDVTPDAQQMLAPDVTCFAVAMFYVHTVSFNRVCKEDGSRSLCQTTAPIAPKHTQSQSVTNAAVTLAGCQAKRCSVQVSAYMCMSSGMLLCSVCKQQIPQKSASKLFCHVAVTTLAVHSCLKRQLHQGPGNCHTAFSGSA